MLPRPSFKHVGDDLCAGFWVWGSPLVITTHVHKGCSLEHVMHPLTNRDLVWKKPNAEHTQGVEIPWSSGTPRLHELALEDPPPLHRVPASLATAEWRLHHEEGIVGVQKYSFICGVVW